MRYILEQIQMSPLQYGLTPSEKSALLKAGVMFLPKPVSEPLSPAKLARVGRLREYWQTHKRGKAS